MTIATTNDQTHFVSFHDTLSTSNFGGAARRRVVRPQLPLRRVSDVSSLGVTTVDSASEWLPAALSRLQMMRSLPADWSSHEAAPPNAVAIRNAGEVLKALSEFDLQPTHINPSAEEGVCISFRNGKKYADIECFNSGDVLAIISNESSETAWDVSERGIRSAVVRVNQFITG